MLRATLFGTVGLVTLTGCANLPDIQFDPLEILGITLPGTTPEQDAEAAQDPAAVEDTAADPAVQPPVEPSQPALVSDSRSLVESVESVVIDQTPTGAIVRASGTAPAQGYFNAQLISLGTQNGVLTLELRAQAPAGTPVQGSARSRLIAAAYVIETNDLLSVRSIRVQSATNVRTSGR